MEKDVLLIEEMTEEQKAEVEKEIAEGTCKVGISAKEMLNYLIEVGVLEEPKAREVLVEEDCLRIINENTELINSELERINKEQKPEEFNIYDDIVPATRYNINLHRHMGSWAVYKPGVVPVSGNQCGYVKPATYGGLSYRCYNKSYSYADTFHIPTQSYGEVQIWVPADQDACRYNPYATYPWVGEMQIDGNSVPNNDWRTYCCQKGYYSTPSHKGSF